MVSSLLEKGLACGIGKDATKEREGTYLAERAEVTERIFNWD